MITYINKSNANKYRALFDKANVELGFEGDNEINSIEEYFSHIKSLVEEKGNRKFTMLPLDEEVFEIDANKRLITIPPSFKANGISVQGDHIAEIIYFKIDRFFDATDLNEMDIYIQWQTPDGPKGQKGSQGISREWVRDVESEPGKLIFGWPLSEEITERSGNVKFAVRFVKFGETEADKNIVYYSFSTLTAEAQIKSALDFAIEDYDKKDILDYSDIILGRLVDSTAPIPNAGESELPVVLLDFKNKHLFDLEDGQRFLHVQAVPEDAGKITYRWRFYGYGKDENGNFMKDDNGNFIMDLVPEETIFSGSANKYLETKDTTPIAGKLYYTIKFAENGDIEESKVLNLGIEKDKEIFDDWVAKVEDAIPVYEFVSEFIAKEVGKYTVQIVNRRGQAAEARIPQNESDKDYMDAHLMAIVPLPAVPVVSGVFVNGSAEEVEKIIIRDPAHPELMLAGEENLPPEKIVLSGLATANPGDVISYKWFKGNEEIAGKTEASLEVSEVEDNAWFYLEGTSFRNNVSLSKKSNRCLVSYPPLNPGIDKDAPTIAWVGDEDPIDGMTYIDQTNRGRFDEYKFKWHSYVVNKDGSGKLDKLLSEEQKYAPTEPGDICVEIFSKYNGKTLVEGALSAPINVYKVED